MLRDNQPPDPDPTLAGGVAATRVPVSGSSDGPTSPGFASTVPVLDPATLLAGRYEILHLLGQGGMGAVFKAIDRELDRKVALKTIRPEMANSPGMLARFKQEIVLARQITHRNVIRIYDLGESAGTRFITMEYVEGLDLRAALQAKGKFTPDEAVEVTQQVCRALEAAHAEGVIHRDLKPQNIMLEERTGRVVVMDFGLARTFDSGMTQTGALVGTMEYMSPEQALGGEVDIRSDLFAIGLIVYELLTGKAPYKADTAIASLLKRAQERAIPASVIDATVPPALSDIVAKCLERDCAERYQTATEILKDLESWRDGKSAQLTSRMVTRPVSVAAQSQTKQWYRTKPWFGIGVGVLLLVLLAAGIAWKLRTQRTTQQTQGANAAPALQLAIIPFRNASGDPKLDWLGGSLAEMLNTDVGQSSQTRNVPPERLHQVLADLRIAPDTSLDDSMLARIAQFSSADTLVFGKYMKFGDSIQIEATVQDLKQNSRVHLKIERASEKDLPGAVDKLAAFIRENLAVSKDIVAELKAQSFKPTSGSLEALRRYDLGTQAIREGQELQAVKDLNAAITADPQFAMAYARLAEAQSVLGYDNEAEQASRKAVELSQQSSTPERYLIQATHARIAKETKKAVAAYEDLAKSAPENADILRALAGLYLDQGDYTKARAAVDKILQANPKNINGLWQKGVVELMSDNPQGALEPLNSGLTLAVQTDNQQQKALLLQAIGISYRLLNKPTDAMQNYKMAMEINRRLGLKRNLAGNLKEMAQLQNMQGKPDAALSSYQQALQLQREIGIKKEVGDTLIDMGVLHSDRGEYDKALQADKESLQIQRDTGDENYEALILNNIGLVYLAKADTDNAITYFQQALQIRNKLNVPGGIAETKHSLGEAYTATAQYDQALASFIEALELWRKIKDSRGAASESHEIGVVFRNQGRYGAAISAMQDAVKGLRDVGERNRDMAEFLSDLADTLAQAGRGNESGKLLDESQALAGDLKNDGLQASILNARGDVARYRGDLSTATVSYQQALRLASHLTEKNQAITARLNLAKVAIAEGRSSVAVNDLRSISAQANSQGLRYLSLVSVVVTGEGLVNMKDYGRARQELSQALGTSERLGLRFLTARIHYLTASALRLSGDKQAAGQYRLALNAFDEMRKEPGAEHLLDRADLKTIYNDASTWSK